MTNVHMTSFIYQDYVGFSHDRKVIFLGSERGEAKRTYDFNSRITYQGIINILHPGEMIGHIDKSYYDYLYGRILILPSLVDVGNILTDQTYKVEVWNANSRSVTLNRIDESGTEGMSLVTYPNTTPIEYKLFQSMIYTLTVTSNGPPVISAIFNYIFDGIPHTLTVIGNRVVPWYYMPQSKFRETFDWLTNVLNTKDTEQRIRLRKTPRASISYSYQLHESYRGEAYNLAYSWSHRLFGVPIWNEQQVVKEIHQGDFELFVDTSYTLFSNGGLLYIYESDMNIAVVEISAVFSDKIVLKKPLTKSYINALVMPMVIGRARGGITFNEEFTTVIKSDITFDVSNVKFRPDIGAWPVYNGKKIFNYDQIRISPPQPVFARLVEVFDNGIAAPENFYTRNFTQKKYVMSFDITTKKDIYVIYGFFFSLYGMQKSFYLPTPYNELIVVEDIAAAGIVIVTSNTNFGKTFSRRDFRMILNDGTIFYRTIVSSIIDNQGREVLTINLPFNRVILTSEIANINYLDEFRLDSDSVTLEYTGANRVTGSVNITSFKET